MAAPLKAHIFSKLSIGVRPCVCSTRWLSSRRDGRKGPPPWAARQIPTGSTFTVQSLVKRQNKEVWKKRMDYVNRSWKKTVQDYNKRKAAIADQPPEEPPQLFFVRRCKSFYGVPKKERDIIQRLGLKEDHKKIIVKNTELNNVLMKKVNHLIEIFPLTFPHGLPESEEDLDHCYITDNGQFIVKKKLEALKKGDNLPVSEGQVENKFEMKQEYIDKLLELRKMRYQINQEYFQTKYIYERNQDKKELRYAGNQDLGYDKYWH